MSYDSYHLFAKYFAYTAQSEPPAIYKRWCLLAGLGAMIGRNCGLPFGSSTIWPNMYVMLIGSPGARKGTAIRQVKLPLKAAGYNFFAADRTSKEKYIVDLAEQSAQDGAAGSVIDSLLFGADLGSAVESFIAAEEFNDFLGQGNMDFASFLGNMWDYSGVYTNRIKTGKSVSINNPTISLLTANTSTGFAAAFPPELIGQGFLSRLLLIYGEPSGLRITIPKPPDELLVQELTEIFARIRKEVMGQFQVTAEAEHYLDAVYQNWQDLDDMRFKTYGTRRFTHLLKLCMVCAASRISTELLYEDCFLANSILSFAETLMPKALGEFGRSKHSETAGKIMELLCCAPAGVSMTDLWKVTSNDFDKYSDLGYMIAKLREADKITFHDSKILANRGALRDKSKYYDFSLLVEAKDKI